ncbi:MAG: suppressor of fused domain protein [Chitinophagaceae bacterium]|nr:suppressor of fused domain protein [Chitinophagaceae bacterium]
MSFFKKLFGKQIKEEPIPQKEFSEEQHDRDYEEKKKGLEDVLGKMHGLVGHAIIPFEVGGAVDMYYFPNHLPGTGFATMELLDPEGNGPKRNRLGTYELVAFTKEPYNENEEAQTPFNLIERRICGIFTVIGSFSTEAVLNPGETCEVPVNGQDNRCLVFDNYAPEGKQFMIGDRKHHLLLCLEVLKSEMTFARKNGSAQLVDLLKQKGFYPYSDLDREPVA